MKLTISFEGRNGAVITIPQPKSYLLLTEAITNAYPSPTPSMACQIADAVVKEWARLAINYASFIQE